MEKSWKRILHEEWEKPYLRTLSQFVSQERGCHAVYPQQEEVFAAFSQTPYHETKVVIVGQDPYHGAGQAHGLSFSVPRGIKPPPSLKNIFKELELDLGIVTPAHGCLTTWAQQGVLLLNATLTVRAGEPKSHAGRGWEQFTDAVIEALNARQDPVVFALWGASAQEKCRQVKGQHSILIAPHPSPYSAHLGFLGCRHFSKINDLLKGMGKEPINWSL